MKRAQDDNNPEQVTIILSIYRFLAEHLDHGIVVYNNEHSEPAVLECVKDNKICRLASGYCWAKVDNLIIPYNRETLVFLASRGFKCILTEEEAYVISMNTAVYWYSPEEFEEGIKNNRPRLTKFRGLAKCQM